MDLITSRTAATVQLLEKAGLSQSQAHLTNDVLGIAGSMGAVAICKAASTAAPGVLRYLPSESAAAGDWVKLNGMLRDTAKGKGKFYYSSVTREQADVMGRAWVGDGYKISNSGKAWISKDGKRQYRLPSYKQRLNKMQANFERKFEGQLWENWPSNAHVDIIN